MLKKHINNEKGMALAMVLMIFAVVSIVAATGLTISLSETKQGVSTQDYVKAYYIARSATDIVSMDIINNIKALEAIKPDITSTQGAIINYNLKKAKVDGMLTDGNVILNGISSNPLTSRVYVTGSTTESTIVVETIYKENGRTSKAKVQLGKISFGEATVTGAKSAIYSWGNINIGNGLTVTGGGNIGYGGTTATIGNNSNIDAVKSTRAVDIIAPHSDIVSSTKRAVDIIATEKKAKGITIHSGMNGNYGEVISDNKSYIDWDVDTGNGDVILVLNKLEVENTATINVSGSGDFYIYLMEKPTTQPNEVSSLLNAKNGFNINTTDGDKAPKTYIISYTKKMQDLYNATPQITNVLDSKTIEPLDLAYIKNSAQLDAFFYLPGCKFTIFEGSPLVKGSIFAGDFVLGNSATVNFNPYKSNSVLFNLNTSSSETHKIPTIKLDNVDLANVTGLNRVWIK